MRTLTTVTDVIDALGGPTLFARILGVTPAAITNWARRGRIPPQWCIKLRRELLQRDIILDESVFDDPVPTRHRSARLSVA